MNHSRGIGHQDVLEEGTPVRVKNMRGTIVSAAERRDQFGGPIVVHTVRLVEKTSRRVGNREVWKALSKPIVKTCNYSFIQLL